MPCPLTLPGKGEEQRAAASLACLLCIQLGSGIESEEVFKTLKPIFKNILADGSANIQARQAVSVRRDWVAQIAGRQPLYAVWIISF